MHTDTEALIARHLGLALREAYRAHVRVARTVPLEDLQQAARFALWTAAEKYTPGRGRFWSYALPRVHGEVYDTVRRWLPAGVRRQGPREVPTALPRFEPLEYCEAAANDPPSVELRDLAERCLSFLPPRPREAVRLRFLDGLRQNQVARRLGCGEAYVSQTLSEWLPKLRRMLEAAGIDAELVYG